MNKKGKALIISIPIVIVIGIIFALCTVRIPGGYVGSIYSARNGISDEVITAGWKFIKPYEHVTKYSIASEEMLLTEDKRDGSRKDESFNTTCKDGVLNVDLEMQYRFNADNIPAIAKRYRGLSGEEIVDTRIKNKAKTYVNEVTANYTVLEAYMDKKSEVNREITDYLRERLDDYGIIVESATLPRTEPDKAIKKAITERSKKAQEVEAAKQEQKKQKIIAETKKIKAKGVAEASVEKAKGRAEANRIESSSITPNLLKKWELEARQKHGWVTVNGGKPIVDTRK